MESAEFDNLNLDSQELLLQSQFDNNESNFSQKLYTLHDSYSKELIELHRLQSECARLGANIKDKDSQQKLSTIRFQCELRGKASRSHRIEYLQLLVTRRQAFIDHAKQRAVKLADLARFLYHADVVLAEYEKSAHTSSTDLKPKELSKESVMLVVNRVNTFNTANKLLNDSKNGLTSMELNIARNLKELIAASYYNWPRDISLSNPNDSPVYSSATRQELVEMFTPKRKESSSYSAQLEQMTPFLEILVNQLTVCVDIWKNIEQAWRETVGNSIDHLIHDCTELTSLRKQADIHRLHNDKLKHLECEVKIKSVSEEITLQVHRLFPGPFRQALDKLIPIVKSAFDVVSKHYIQLEQEYGDSEVEVSDVALFPTREEYQKSWNVGMQQGHSWKYYSNRTLARSKTTIARSGAATGASSRISSNLQPVRTTSLNSRRKSYEYHSVDNKRNTSNVTLIPLRPLNSTSNNQPASATVVAATNTFTVQFNGLEEEQHSGSNSNTNSANQSKDGNALALPGGSQDINASCSSILPDRSTYQLNHASGFVGMLTNYQIPAAGSTANTSSNIVVASSRNSSKDTSSQYVSSKTAAQQNLAHGSIPAVNAAVASVKNGTVVPQAPPSTLSINSPFVADNVIELTSATSGSVFDVGSGYTIDGRSSFVGVLSGYQMPKDSTNSGTNPKGRHSTTGVIRQSGVNRQSGGSSDTGSASIQSEPVNNSSSNNNSGENAGNEFSRISEYKLQSGGGGGQSQPASSKRKKSTHTSSSGLPRASTYTEGKAVSIAEEPISPEDISFTRLSEYKIPKSTPKNLMNGYSPLPNIQYQPRRAASQKKSIVLDSKDDKMFSKLEGFKL